MSKSVTPTIEHPKTLLIGIQSPKNRTHNIESYYQEFINLVKSNGIEFDRAEYIKLRHIDPAYFLTSGKLDDVVKLCKEENFEEVIFSEPLSAQQERNLSKVLKARVFDRNQLILEIFEKGAHSAEGKTQVQLALLQHKKSRLAGHGVHMSQQTGRAGAGGAMRGPGETAKEKEIQHIERQMHRYRQDLKKLSDVRAVQRKQRTDRNVPQIALIGYTNAGKSTILNLLTKSSIYTEDKPFATLDTTTRELYIDKEKIGVISDTVGFIQQLPHKLVEAFKSTLIELQYAHLLLHVIDISDPNWQSHIRVVHDVLQELNVDKPQLYVFNKADKVKEDEDIDTEKLTREIQAYEPHVVISAQSKEDALPLIDFIKKWKKKTYDKR
jgi:GTP-binding protein HflX